MAMRTDRVIRCSSPAVSYGKVLAGLDIPEESVSRTQEILKEVPRLAELFLNPTVAQQKKLDVIDRVFPEEMRQFMKNVCIHHRMNLLDEIFEAYNRCLDEKGRVIRAVLTCTEAPDAEQQKGMEAFLRRKYGADRALIEIRHDGALLGGFILRVGNDEYDWSMKGRLDRLAEVLGGR